MKLAKKISLLAMIAVVAVPMLTIAVAANADANAMLFGGYEGNVQAASGLGNTDPRTMVGSIVKIILGFLGIIAVILILYGGFRWMTAAGNEDGIASAKKTIAAGVIGLVIILMAFGIAQFVINALYNATGATG
jgi:hypothetical protein